MIDETYARLLANKVADAVIKRLGNTSDDHLAREDLVRIRRLVADGQIQGQKLQSSLENIEQNESLSNDLRSEATTELPHHRRDEDRRLLENSKFPEPFEYRSSNTLLPGTWPADDLVKRGWTPIIGKELAGFLAQISPVDGVIRVVPKTTQCHWRLLPWYSEVALVRIHDPTWQDRNLVLYYLTTLKGNLYRLNGTSPPIHEMNAKAPIRLNEDNVLDYARFFCFFVRGDEGPFYIVEHEDDPFISVLEHEPNQFDLREHLSPAILKKVDATGKFLCSATMYYSNAIFKAELAVQTSGMIDMLTDNPKVGDLPARVEAPIGWSKKF